MVRKIGILFGMEDTFPWALIDAINARSGEGVAAEPVAVSYLNDRASFEYDLILDRISHVVPFYRTFLKAAIYQGIQVINNIDVAVETEPDRIRDALARQAAGPVRWAQIIRAMAAEGVTHVVECGPGRVLAGLTKRIAPGLESLALTDPASIVEALARLKG
jgi:malonyl CoA-acyl carrier protein transacylase